MFRCQRGAAFYGHTERWRSLGRGGDAAECEAKDAEWAYQLTISSYTPLAFSHPPSDTPRHWIIRSERSTLLRSGWHTNNSTHQGGVVLLRKGAYTEKRVVSFQPLCGGRIKVSRPERCPHLCSRRRARLLDVLRLTVRKEYSTRGTCCDWSCRLPAESRTRQALSGQSGLAS